MPSYWIEMTATACVWRQQVVEAASEEEAIEMALAKARADKAYPGNGSEWELNGLVDDNIEVTNSEEE